MVIKVNGKSVDSMEAFYEAEGEGRILRATFPEDCWDNEEPRGFDFIKNVERIKGLLGTFRDSIAIARRRNEVPPGLGFITGWSNTERLDEALTWANEFQRFYGVGVQLQREGKNPEIEISGPW